MPFSYHLDKDPKPVMDDSRLPKGGHHNGKDINILVVGLKGVGKSGRFSNFFSFIEMSRSNHGLRMVRYMV